MLIRGERGRGMVHGGDRQFGTTDTQTAFTQQIEGLGRGHFM